MSEKEQADKLVNRRNAISTALLGLPLGETLGLLAEVICAVLHAENVKPRSLEFSDFEVTLTNVISDRLEEMEGESRPEKTEPEYSDLQRAYRQTVRPLLVLTNREAECVVTEILARLLYDQGVRGSPEELEQFRRAFGTNVGAIFQQLTVDADNDFELALADVERDGATVH